MEIPQTRFKRLTFPGKAGEHQRAGATASLVRELGDNYSAYHRYLAGELEKIGRPIREDYPNEQAYLETWTYVQELVLAEALARNCLLARRGQRPLDAAWRPGDPPLVRDDNLVAFESSDD